MIIASALGRLFDGAEFVYDGQPKAISYGYGDNLELLAWLKNQEGVVKYPLIWYILSEYTEFDGWYETDANIYIMQNTMSEWLNPTRQAESYTKILEPVWKEVEQKLTISGYVQVMGAMDTRFKLTALPKFSLNEKNNATDIVDALVVRFRLRIKANCIN